MEGLSEAFRECNGRGMGTVRCTKTVGRARRAVGKRIRNMLTRTSQKGGEVSDCDVGRWSLEIQETHKEDSMACHIHYTKRFMSKHGWCL